MQEWGNGVIVGLSEGVLLVNPCPAAGENDPALIHNYLLLLCTLLQRRGNIMSLSPSPPLSLSLRFKSFRLCLHS